MTYFTKDFLQFFRDLKKNNHRDWFDDNRKRYQTSVKEPFYSFVNHMIELVNQQDSTVQIVAKDAVMRINRDIRFSADKTPTTFTMGQSFLLQVEKTNPYLGFLCGLARNTWEFSEALME